MTTVVRYCTVVRAAEGPKGGRRRRRRRKERLSLLACLKPCLLGKGSERWEVGGREGGGGGRQLR